MNLIDWIIVGILGLSVLVGLYRGFISSVASMGSCLVSLGASYWLTPKVVDFVTNHTTLRETISSYNMASAFTSKLIGTDIQAKTQVSGLSPEQITEAVHNMKLPAPLDSLVESDLTNQVFKSVGDVGGYVSETIVNVIMNIICFVIAFILLTILFHIIINLLNAIFKFPVLKQMNSVTGGIFGLLRGVLLCFVAFAMLPLFQTIIPDNVNELVEGSVLAPLFNSRNLIVSIMKGQI